MEIFIATAKILDLEFLLLNIDFKNLFSNHIKN